MGLSLIVNIIKYGSRNWQNPAYQFFTFFVIKPKSNTECNESKTITSFIFSKSPDDKQFLSRRFHAGVASKRA